MPTQVYAGDLSPRTAAHANKMLLERGQPYLVAELFGDGKPLKSHATKTQSFRRYEALPSAPKVLTEGVTPASANLDVSDYEATLEQYGDWVELSDVILDTHEDPILAEITEILGEQSPQMIERTRFNVLKAGSNVFFANGASRTTVNAKITRALQRKITRSLKRQNARKVTKKVSASPNYATEPVAPSFIGIAHTDVEGDIRDMEGFVPVEKYGSGMSPYEMELGKVEDVRYLCSSMLDPWADAGGDPSANGVISTSGGAPGQADVYPVLFIAQHAYGIVPFKGKFAVQTIIRNPKADSSDPLAQRGSAGWKSMTTALILNDAWMARAEVAVTA